MRRGALIRRDRVILIGFHREQNGAVPGRAGQDHLAPRKDPLQVRSVRQQNVLRRRQGFQSFHMLIMVVPEFFQLVPVGDRFQPLNRRLVSVDGVIFELQKLADNGLLVIADTNHRNHR